MSINSPFHGSWPSSSSFFNYFLKHITIHTSFLAHLNFSFFKYLYVVIVIECFGLRVVQFPLIQLPSSPSSSSSFFNYFLKHITIHTSFLAHFSFSFFKYLYVVIVIECFGLRRVVQSPQLHLPSSPFFFVCGNIIS